MEHTQPEINTLLAHAKTLIGKTCLNPTGKGINGVIITDKIEWCDYTEYKGGNHYHFKGIRFWHHGFFFAILYDANTKTWLEVI